MRVIIKTEEDYDGKEVDLTLVDDVIENRTS